MQKMPPWISKTGIVYDMAWVKGRVKIVGECWEWQGSLTGYGHGKLNIGTSSGKSLTTCVHRYVFCLVKENIMETRKVIVRHLCDNAKCCNPDHLEKGSTRDNYFDSEVRHKTAATKRRLEKRRSHNTQLPDSLATAIRKDFLAGGTVGGISEKYGVSKSVVSPIVRGLTYKRCPLTDICKAHALSAKRKDKAGPQGVINLSCSWCKREFSRKKSDYDFWVRKGKTNFYCCLSHQAKHRHQTSRDERQMSTYKVLK